MRYSVFLVAADADMHGFNDLTAAKARFAALVTQNSGVPILLNDNSTGRTIATYQPNGFTYQVL